MKKIPALLFTVLVALIYRVWCLTLRCEEVGREKVDELSSAGRLMAFSLWHDELFAIIYRKRQLDLATVVSRSKDGEYLAKLLATFGLRTVRGSSSRGGASALHRAVSLMRKMRCHVCVTVDGPRGPRHQVKNGILFMAAQAEALLVPTRMFYNRSKKFGSWDRFQLPLPFSRVRLVFGEPYEATLTKTGDSLALETEKEKLTGKMLELEKEHAFKR